MSSDPLIEIFTYLSDRDNSLPAGQAILWASKMNDKGDTLNIKEVKETLLEFIPQTFEFAQAAEEAGPVPAAQTQEESAPPPLKSEEASAEGIAPETSDEPVTEVSAESVAAGSEEPATEEPEAPEQPVEEAEESVQVKPVDAALVDAPEATAEEVATEETLAAADTDAPAAE